VTRTKRIVVAACVTLVALLLLTVTAAVALLRSDWFREQVRLRIVREVENASGGRVEIGEFRFHWARLEGEVARFVLHGKETAGEPPLFQAGSMRVVLKVASFLRRDIILQEVLLSSPQLHIIVYEDGRTNLPEPPVKRLRRNPVEQFVALAIRRFRIEQGAVSINERRIPLNVSGEDLSARLFYELQGERYTGRMSVRNLTIAAPAGRIPPLDADLSIALEKNRLIVEKAALTGPDSAIAATATIENFLSPRLQAAFQASLALEQWTPPQLPARLAGTLRLDGTLAYENGERYLAAAKISGSGLSVKTPQGAAGGITLSSSLRLEPGSLRLEGLSLSALGGVARGEASLENWRRFRWSGGLDGISIAELFRLRGAQAEGLEGVVSGPASIEGEFAGGAASRWRASGEFSIQAIAKGHPVQGMIALAFDQGTGALEVRQSWLSTDATKLRLDGTLQREIRVSAETTRLEDLDLAAAFAGVSLPSPLPVRLEGGTARFNGLVSGRLDDPRIGGRLSVTNLSYEGRTIERLEATLAAGKDSLEATAISANWHGARLEGSGRIGLQEWKAVGSSPVSASLTLRNLPLQDILAEAGSKVPVRGLMNGSFQVGGKIESPEVDGKVEAAQTVAYGQRLDATSATVRLRDRSLILDAVRLNSGKASFQGRFGFTPQPDTWKKGTLSFALSAKQLKLAQARKIAKLEADVDGDLEFQLEGEAEAGERFLLSLLHGKGSLRNLTLNQQPAGQLDILAETQGDLLEVSASGQIAGSRLSVRGRSRLLGRFETDGEITFGRVALSALLPLAQPGKPKELPLEAFAEGKLSFSGSILDSASWKGRLELSRADIQPEAGENNSALRLSSSAPVVIALDRKQAAVQSARFTGAGSNLEGRGRILFGARGPTYDLRVLGNVNLEVLRNLDRNLTAAGASEIDITVRGRMDQPDIYGRLRLIDASFYLRGIPNGIDSANGDIFVFRDRATFDRLVARTGSGTLQVSGFVSFGGDRAFYQVKAAARQVRVRYPEGVSTTFDAALELRGTAQRSILSGTATVLRSSIAPNLDFASLLARPPQPMAPPAAPNELLNGMQLDVTVTTAPNARFENSLARNLQAEADLRLQGTPYKPVLLGRIVVNQGEINFLGGSYRISRGIVTFANPVRLEPLLDLDLYTRVRGIDVTMNFTGPLDKLNLTYRSDPPLQVNEIIALLAVGRAPSSDLAVQSQQNQRDQSWQQLGASKLIGTAVEALEGGRLQRFFGVSRIKIDPNLTGLGRTPEAQITLEQQVSRDITFTYVTNLAQEQQTLVRVEWNLSRQWSVLAVRDENGLFGIEVQFRRQFK